MKVLLNRVHPPLSLRQVKYEAGRHLFPISISPDAAVSLSQTEIPLLNPDAQFSREDVKFASLKVIKDEALFLDKLKIDGPDYLQFRQGSRKMWIIPKSVSAPSVSIDERNSNPRFKFKKVEVSFELPAGSYATVILKAIGVEKKRRR